MAKFIRPGFSGELATQVKWQAPKFRSRSIYETDKEYTKRRRKWEKEADAAMCLACADVIAKIPLLRERYNVAPVVRGDSLILTLLLKVCEEFIPGFRIDYGSRKRGPKKKWDMFRYSELWADVESMKRERGCSDRQACWFLIKRAVSAHKGRYLPRKHLLVEKAVASLESRLREARQPKHNEAAIAFYFQRARLGTEKAITLLIRSFPCTGVRE